MSPRRGLDERYPVDITNPLLALGACEGRLGEILVDLEAMGAAHVAVGLMLSEQAAIAKQQHAIAVLIRKAHEGRGDD